MGGLREFSKVMQTFDCVPGFHNYLEFSESPRVKSRKELYCLNTKRSHIKQKFQELTFRKRKYTTPPVIMQIKGNQI